MLLEVEDAELLRMLLGDRCGALLAGIPLTVLLTCGQPALRRAGLDVRSADRLAAAGEIARRYVAQVAHAGRDLQVDAKTALPSLGRLLTEIGFIVFEDTDDST